MPLTGLRQRDRIQRNGYTGTRCSRFQGRGIMTLEEAWVEFNQQTGERSIHVSLSEAKELLRELTDNRAGSQSRRPEKGRAYGRFLDWLLHVKQEKRLAYELLRKTGTVTVGPREYWATEQGGKPAIAWESSYTYPGTDSEIWDVIPVDEES